MISFLIKPASSMCNMRCSYCFYCDEAQNRKNASLGFMKKETAENIIKKAAQFSREAMFVFQGGEPLLSVDDLLLSIVILERDYWTEEVVVALVEPVTRVVGECEGEKVVPQG